MKTEFITITRQEYEEIKKEILTLFKFARVKRNNQNYALGGFRINPKDYDNGFTLKQIDKLSDYLRGLKIDTESLDISRNEVYGNDQGKFSGTKVNHFVFKDGIYFLMRLKGGLKNE